MKALFTQVIFPSGFGTYRPGEIPVSLALGLLWLALLLASPRAAGQGGFGPITEGTSSQVFYLMNSTPETDDPTPCGIIGAESQWFLLRVTTNGYHLRIDTSGSAIPTILGVYSRSNLLSLTLVTCDRNSAPDERSLVVFPAQAGIDYYVAVSGVNGAGGLVRLNWCLGTPPLITQQPEDQLASPGADVTLAVSASSSSALAYQWRLNGVNIRGATSPTLTLTNVGRTNAGLYSVTVAGSCLTADSRPARVLVEGTAVSLADNFADRVIETAASSEGNGHNIGTTLEAGELPHAGLSGGRSVWLGWSAPANGLATISTRGSGFDTLLAVYTNAVPGTVPAVDSLANVAGDDDEFHSPAP